MTVRIPPARRSIAALLLALLAGCQSWHATTVNPRTLLPEEQPSYVRLTLTDGTIVTIKNPIVRNDSIVSAEAAEAAQLGGLRSESVALGDVQSVEVERFSTAKTIGLAVVIVGGIFGWARSVGTAGGGGEPGSGPLPKR